MRICCSWVKERLANHNVYATLRRVDDPFDPHLTVSSRAATEAGLLTFYGHSFLQPLSFSLPHASDKAWHPEKNPPTNGHSGRRQKPCPFPRSRSCAPIVESSICRKHPSRVVLWAGRARRIPSQRGLGGRTITFRDDVEAVPAIERDCTAHRVLTSRGAGRSGGGCRGCAVRQESEHHRIQFDAGRKEDLHRLRNVSFPPVFPSTSLLILAKTLWQYFKDDTSQSQSGL